MTTFGEHGSGRHVARSRSQRYRGSIRVHALKLLETDAPFDIVVTDYAMPGMSGFELAQRIKEKNPKLPIILATGYAELPADRAIKFGHLSKPYTSKDLASALERALSSG